MNLLLKVQKEIKGGFNTLINRIVCGVKNEISICQEAILLIMGKKIGLIEISINDMKVNNEKMLSFGFGRLYESLRDEIRNGNNYLFKRLGDIQEGKDLVERLEENFRVFRVNLSEKIAMGGGIRPKGL
jgi:hypothetical protein